MARSIPTSTFATLAGLAVLLGVPLAPALGAPAVDAAVSSGEAEAEVLRTLEARAGEYAALARQIWELAELGYKEVKSSALLQARLGAAGFEVKAGVADMPTAFVATAGSGQPVIGLMAEFDALPGLSQEAQPARKPVVDGGAGHGCGHHLLGTASVAAAIALKEWLAAGRRAGTIRLLGTPAEEGGSGKVYLLRAGYFAGLAAVLEWHPGDRNVVWSDSSLANVTAKFRFRGVAAHAASAPEKGRSALDGVEAMNHMVNLMREHLPSDARVHYIISNGGRAPNVVPDLAEVYTYARHPQMKVLDGIWERILAAARGAALGTGTSVEHEMTGAVWNVLPNETLDQISRRSLTRVGGVTFTPAERSFAERLRATLAGPLIPLEAAGRLWDPVKDGRREGAVSTDVGDVSWNVPVAQLTTATFVPGTPLHSWQAVAAGGSSIGAKGMMVAAKTMTLTAIELYSRPEHLARARAELTRRRGEGFVYRTRLANRKPPLNYRD